MESVRGVRGRAILGAGMLGGIATASGIALTATSGWLIVRASERPPILLLLTAIVAVRAFGMARPVFRYWERLRSHDVALAGPRRPTHHGIRTADPTHPCPPWSPWSRRHPDWCRGRPE